MSSSSVGKAQSKFKQKVLTIIKKIPRGKVLTYGQVATLAGIPRASRIVGGILFQQNPFSKIPWQRVVNSQGGISTYRVGFGERQRALLEKEGISFNRAGLLDLSKYQWWPRESLVKKFELEDDVAKTTQKKFQV